MSYPSPLLKMHEEAGALLTPWGPAEHGILAPQVFDHLELEYAAIRKGAGVLDLPQRALVEVEGADRIAFLNRMLTQEIKDLPPGRVRRSFWLNRKGRIDADIRVIAREHSLLLDLDALAAAHALESLSAFIIADEVELRDRTGERHRLAVHGPGAFRVLAAAGGDASALEPDEARNVRLAGHECMVDRDDATGEIGLELIVPTAAAPAIYAALLAGGARPIGWHAFNIARIESGRPIFNLDFGPDSLPHETGVLDDRVSFTKGCYLGQEVVARMQSRGHSKRRLVALLIETPAVASGGELEVAQPETGAAVFAAGGDPPGEPIGAVTSSAVSPMSGARAIAFAQVKPGHDAPGGVLRIDCGGTLLDAVVQPSLRTLPR